MFRSTTLGCAAGLLLALDGFHLVLSRTALLDIFLLLFVLAAFGALVLDRDARRRRWARALDDGPRPDPSRAGPAGPPRGWRDWPWWRLLAGVLLGCACAVKWSGSTSCRPSGCSSCSGRSALRRVGRGPSPVAGRPPGRAALAGARRAAGGRDLPGQLVGLAAHRRRLLPAGQPLPEHARAERHADHRRAEQPVRNTTRPRSSFHTRPGDPHKYQSWPWQWLLLGRPVAFYWSRRRRLRRAELRLGDPAAGHAAALVVVPAGAGRTVWLGVGPARLAGRGDPARRRRPACCPGSGTPWTAGRCSPSTPRPALPFLVLAVVYVLGAIMSPAGTPDRPPRPAAPRTVRPGTGRHRRTPHGGRHGSGRHRTTARRPRSSSGRRCRPAEQVADRRLVGGVIAGAYVLLVALCFAYFYPIFVGTAAAVRRTGRPGCGWTAAGSDRPARAPRCPSRPTAGRRTARSAPRSPATGPGSRGASGAPRRNELNHTPEHLHNGVE